MLLDNLMIPLEKAPVPPKDPQEINHTIGSESRFARASSCSPFPYLLSYKFHHLPASRFRDAALRRIGTLFALEALIQGKPPDQRLRHRQQMLKPAFEEWHRFLQAAAEHFPKASVEAAAIRYGLADDVWPGFCRLLEDGQLDIHSNPVENIQRPVKPTQRNALFAGSRDALGIWVPRDNQDETQRQSG